jgi:hypothetical protein
MRAGILSFGVLIIGAIFCVFGASNALALTDGQARDLMIKASIASFKGACPCPYSFTAEGLRCGTQSAWSKKFGTGPRLLSSGYRRSGSGRLSKQNGL